MRKISIPRNNVEDFAHVIAELTRQGLEFESKLDDGNWVITVIK